MRLVSPDHRRRGGRDGGRRGDRSHRRARIPAVRPWLLAELDAGATGAARRARPAGSGAPRTPAVGCNPLGPVPDPQKIVCLGLNYSDHAEETGQEIPTAPMWFAKFQNSLIGSGATIVLPGRTPTTSTTRPSSRS